MSSIRSVHAILFLSCTTIVATPLIALSVQPGRNDVMNRASIVSLNTLSSSIARPKSKVMTNIAATQRPNFSGKWILDSNASDSADEILKAQGASWLERQAAKTAKITQDIKQDSNQVTVTLGTPVKSRTEVLKLDGSSQVSDGDRLGTIKTKTFWDGDGTTLVSVIEPTESSQNFTQLKISRKLQDQGKTLVQAMEMKLKNGQMIKANRIFRKAS
jgi:hypothetical protein